MTRAILITLILWLGSIGLHTAQESTASLNDDRFIQLYVENTLLTERYLNQQDTLKILQDRLFRDHKTTRDEFIAFLKHYDEEPEKFTSIWQKITHALDEHRKATNPPDSLRIKPANPKPDPKKSK
ncbi:MAG: hypothetical protein KBA26_03205 [Candidatus Delongbacteria bacterium]|nr:hypothetical protein [Candidatus Delongbacteria bacterium]